LSRGTSVSWPRSSRPRTSSSNLGVQVGVARSTPSKSRVLHRAHHWHHRRQLTCTCGSTTLEYPRCTSHRGRTELLERSRDFVEQAVSRLLRDCGSTASAARCWCFACSLRSPSVTTGWSPISEPALAQRKSPASSRREPQTARELDLGQERVECACSRAIRVSENSTASARRGERWRDRLTGYLRSVHDPVRGLPGSCWS